MSQTNTPFRREEYDRRLTKTRAAMAERGLDVLIATDPSNQAWLTGYDGWSFYVHQAVILPIEGRPIWWGRRSGRQRRVRTVDTDRTDVVGYPDNYVQSTERHPMQHLAALLKELGHGTPGSASRWTTTISRPRPSSPCHRR